MIKTNAIKAISLLWVGSLAGAGFAFLTQVLLARGLGSSSFGIFFSSLSTITLLAPLAGFGISQFWLKIFGAEGWAAIRWIKPSIKFVVVSTTLLILVVIFGTAFFNHDVESKKILTILSFYILGQLSVELVSSKLQLEERYTRLALWQLLPHLLRFIIVLAATTFYAEYISVYIYALFYSAVAIVFFVFSLPELLAMKNGDFKLRGHKQAALLSRASDPTALNAASESWPFGIAAFAYLIYFQSNIILLKYISGNQEAGLYSVAFTIMTAVYLLPSVIYQRFLTPKIHRWANHEPEKFYKVYRTGNWVMLVLGAAAMIAIYILADWAVPLFFGEQYRESAEILKILSLSAPIIFVAFSAGATLVTQQHMKIKVKYMMAVALINLLLNLLLIPKLHTTGAAIATVISNTILLILYMYGAKKFVFKIVQVKS